MLIFNEYKHCTDLLLLMFFMLLGTMLIFMIVGSITSGPGNILALNTMIRYGWKVGRKLILRIICGYLTVQYLCTFVLMGLNQYVHSILSVLKYFDAAYLLWLAYHVLVSKQTEEKQDKKASFLVGYGMQIVNIKIYFYINYDLYDGIRISEFP